MKIVDLPENLRAPSPGLRLPPSWIFFNNKPCACVNSCMHQHEKAEVTIHRPHPQLLAVTFVGDNALGFLGDSVLPRAPAFFSAFVPFSIYSITSVFKKLRGSFPKVVIEASRKRPLLCKEFEAAFSFPTQMEGRVRDIYASLT